MPFNANKQIKVPVTPSAFETLKGFLWHRNEY
jgi:hypothetical protein